MPTPADLVTSARCLTCLTREQHDAVRTYSLAIWAGGSTDPVTLSELAKCFVCVPNARALRDYLFCLIRNSGSCLPGDVVTDAKCFTCLDRTQRESVETWLIMQVSGVTDTIEQVVTAARCFMCLPHMMHMAIQNYLLCQISGGAAPEQSFEATDEGIRVTTDDGKNIVLNL